MRVDITKFNLLNVIDTCSIWNILSSQLLTFKSEDCGCQFCCTQFVKYECLSKPRTKKKNSDIELQNRLKMKINDGRYQDFPINLEDLQDVEIIRNRKRISKGEISSMIFAKKTRQAFLTDDQGARKVSEEYIGLTNTQTTPQLLGWLTYSGKMLDSEKDTIIMQHKNLDGILEKHFQDIYLKALELRLQN